MPKLACVCLCVYIDKVLIGGGVQGRGDDAAAARGRGQELRGAAGAEVGGQQRPDPDGRLRDVDPPHQQDRLAGRRREVRELVPGVRGDVTGRLQIRRNRFSGLNFAIKLK